MNKKIVLIFLSMYMTTTWCMQQHCVLNAPNNLTMPQPYVFMYHHELGSSPIVSEYVQPPPIQYTSWLHIFTDHEADRMELIPKQSSTLYKCTAFCMVLLLGAARVIQQLAAAE